MEILLTDKLKIETQYAASKTLCEFEILTEIWIHQKHYNEMTYNTFLGAKYSVWFCLVHITTQK